jgi:hypothetical protein
VCARDPQRVRVRESRLQHATCRATARGLQFTNTQYRRLGSLNPRNRHGALNPTTATLQATAPPPAASRTDFWPIVTSRRKVPAFRPRHTSGSDQAVHFTKNGGSISLPTHCSARPTCHLSICAAPRARPLEQPGAPLSLQSLAAPLTLPRRRICRRLMLQPQSIPNRLRAPR